MPRILFGSHNYWTTPLQVGSHALARAFAARGWDVGYVSDPISPLHLLQGASGVLRQRAELWRGGGRMVGGPHLESCARRLGYALQPAASAFRLRAPQLEPLLPFRT